jgi:YVTN family beta-propeller protein
MSLLNLFWWGGPMPIALSVPTTIPQRVLRILEFLAMLSISSVLTSTAHAGTVVIPVGSSPWSVATNAATGRIYVANLDGGSVTVIDGNTNGVIATVRVLPFPFNLAVDATKNTVYVPGYTTNAVDLLDGPSNTVPVVIPAVGDVPSAVAINPTTQRLYVALHNDMSVRIVDVGSLPFAFLGTISLGHVPSGIAVDSAANLIYVALEQGTIEVIDGSSNKIVDSMSVGSLLHSFVLNASTKTIYAIADGLLKVLDLTTKNVTSTVTVGQTPWQVAFNPLTGSIFVVNYDDDTVTVVDASIFAVIGTVHVGHHPAAVSVMQSTGVLNKAENKVYVANSADNTVSVFSDPALAADMIYIPVRWCAVEGSPAASGTTVPAGQTWVDGNSMTDAKLLGILRAASDKVWMANNAEIAFRSATASHIPIVADPSPPRDKTQELGDLDISNFASELKDAAANCGLAWQKLFPEQVGTVAVNLRKFVSNGSVLGETPAANISLQVNGARSADLCVSPRNLLPSDLPAWVSIEDGQIEYMFQGADYLTLAHELGHSLLLGHGNGLDDNHDGLLPPNPGPRRYDGYCDALGPQEDTTTGTTCDDHLSLMEPDQNCHNLRPLQLETARDAAEQVNGQVSVVADPGGERYFDPNCRIKGCPPVPDLQVLRIGASEISSRGTFEFFLQLFDAVPKEALNEYVLLVDLDSNLYTGCSAASLGLKNDFRGVDLVARITTKPGPNGQKAVAAIWTCQAGHFGLSTNKQVRVNLSRQNIPHSNGAYGGISILFPRSFELRHASRIRVQLLTRRVSPATTYYRFPTGRDVATVISIVPPVLPVCTVTPASQKPGGRLILRASDLVPSHGTGFFLGDQQVGSASTDNKGNVVAVLGLPTDTVSGVRLISVVSDGTAITAVCSVRVSPVLLRQLEPRLDDVSPITNMLKRRFP